MKKLYEQRLTFLSIERLLIVPGRSIASSAKDALLDSVATSHDQAMVLQGFICSHLRDDNTQGWGEKLQGFGSLSQVSDLALNSLHTALCLCSLISNMYWTQVTARCCSQVYCSHLTW